MRNTGFASLSDVVAAVKDYFCVLICFYYSIKRIIVYKSLIFLLYNAMMKMSNKHSRNRGGERLCCMNKRINTKF